MPVAPTCELRARKNRRSRRVLRAVLWDVYGTLVHSRAAEPLQHIRAEGVGALRELLPLLGWPLRTPDAAERVQMAFQRAVLDLQARGAPGTLRCEVDVREAWRQALSRAARHGWIRWGGGDVERLSTMYEMLTNPARPAPGAHALLREIARRGVKMGIVSNAQFYTAELLQCLFPTPHGGPFWDADLAVWSWECGIAKPAAKIFNIAARRVCARGWTPAHVVVVGDRLDNDILPALRSGFCAFWLTADQADCTVQLQRLSPESRLGWGRSFDHLRAWLGRTFCWPRTGRQVCEH